MCVFCVLCVNVGSLYGSSVWALGCACTVHCVVCGCVCCMWVYGCVWVCSLCVYRTCYIPISPSQLQK